MPRKKRDGGLEVLYLEVPAFLKAWLETQADANRRSTTAEAIVILESHLEPRHQAAARAKLKEKQREHDR